MKLGFALYAIMLISGAIQGVLSTDEAAKYVDPSTLWIWRSVLGVLNVTSTGLKAFTSEAFGKWVEGRKNGNGNGHAPTNTGP